MGIDRRILFILVFLGVFIPLLKPIGLPVEVSPPVKNIFDAIRDIDGENQALMISVDYDPSVEPEIYPMHVALLKHCFTRKIPVVMICLQAPGVGLGELALRDATALFPDVVRGVDYCYLGFKPGPTPVMLRIGQGIAGAFPTDYYGTPIEEIPLMRRVKTYNDIALVVSLAGNTLPELWISNAYVTYGQKIAAGVTAVMAADFYPWLQTGQMIGLLGGLKGAAEYERLIDMRDKATRGMDAQSMVHVLIIFFIIVGNIGYFMTHRRSI
jgi:hypothetical protein